MSPVRDGSSPTGPTLDAPGFRHRSADLEGVRLHVAEAGSGPAVLLLHGFPECWWSWRQQIVTLSRSGYRVLAPDLRGYNTSDRPRRVSAYAFDRLVADVTRLVDWTGGPVRGIVGHDWGGVLAWGFAHRHPERFERLAILNAPHPRAMARELARNPLQLLRSWYMGFFQLPWLPELALSVPDLHRRLFRADGVPDRAYSEEDLEVYRNALRRPGARTGMVNWYRAAFRERLGVLNPPDSEALPTPGSRGPIRRPVLVLWGENDRYLGPGLLEGLEKWARDLTIERLPGVSHWLQVEAPDRVNRALLDFLSGGSGEG